MNRRNFIKAGFSFGALALGTGCRAVSVRESKQDWKTVFRRMGFDPEAEGCGVFAVVGDPHVANTPSATFEAAIRTWNAMSPRPLFALSVGDQLCGISRQFGDREWPVDPRWRSAGEKEIAGFKALLTPLEVPFRHVVGNHDTYPDEQDARFYASHFPGWRPYDRFDACGVQFFLLNSGHDGWIDPVQEAWMSAEARKLDPSRAVVLVAHQPNMLRHRENGIPRTIRKVFADWKGELWFLGGTSIGTTSRDIILPTVRRLRLRRIHAPFSAIGFTAFGRVRSSRVSSCRPKDSSCGTSDLFSERSADGRSRIRNRCPATCRTRDCCRFPSKT